MVRFLCLLIFCSSIYAEITALYLSWQGDPTTTMTIQWHTPAAEPANTLSLQTAEGEWEPFEGESTSLEQILIHKVALESLQPNREYAFRIGQEERVYRFQTAPQTLDEPLRFIVGGDLYAKKKLFRRMSRTVLEHKPQFVVLGGDIAYAIHPLFSSSLRRWLAFLRDWKECMIDAEGRIIPFLLVPGNHDIAPDNYELFFTLFAFPKKQLYRAVDFGNYLSLFLLDTGHFQPIEGRQTVWLDKALTSRNNIPYRFAVYHEAAYPSFYPYQGPTPRKIRANWVPLFEKHHLLAAFENHNHTFKRTYPLKGGQIDPAGVVYLGDGGWGVASRRPHDLWYLAQKSKKNNILLVELTPQSAEIQAFDLLNRLLDQIEIAPVNN